ncbi:hypothetical conserved protein [Novosphingobium sp. MBES04]|nr:hypothetical conserved protein [Novosphingobium sp. MBES04]
MSGAMTTRPARFIRRFARPAALALPLAAALLSSGCASTRDYPSLSIREVERNMRARPSKAEEAETPQLPAASADLATRLDGLVAMARTADGQFADEKNRAERAVAAAGGRTSDSWSAAQIALAALESHRSHAMTALAELDQLYVDARDEAPLAPSPKAESIAAARDTVSDIISAQDSVIDGLSARLAG